MCYALFFLSLTKTMKENANHDDPNRKPIEIMNKCILGLGLISVICLVVDQLQRILNRNYCQSSYILVFTIAYSIISIAFCLIGMLYCDSILDQLRQAMTEGNLEFDYTLFHGIDQNFLLDQLFYLKSVVIVDTINSLCNSVTHILKYMINSYERTNETGCHLFVAQADGDRQRFYNQGVFYFELSELIFYAFEMIFEMFLPMGIVQLIFYETCKYQNHESQIFSSNKLTDSFDVYYPTKNLRYGDQHSSSQKER